MRRDVVKVLKVYKGSAEYLNDFIDVYLAYCLKNNPTTTYSNAGLTFINMEADTCIYYLNLYPVEENIKDNIYTIQHKITFQRGIQVALTIPNVYANDYIPAYGKKFYKRDDLRDFVKELIIKAELRSKEEENKK